MSGKIFALLAAMGCLAISGTAMAGTKLTTEPATDIFTVTVGDSVVGTYQQSLAPQPGHYIVGGLTTATITNATGVFAGTHYIVYFTNDLGGGFNVGDSVIQGHQIFSGTVQSPVFAANSYTDLFYYGGTVPIGATLTISALTSVASAAPEPASWMMMVLGFGMIGYALRSRHSLLFHKA